MTPRRTHGFIESAAGNWFPIPMHLEIPKTKEILEQVIERARSTHNFLLYAYVLMPEHLHLLLSESKNHSLSSTIRVIKGESSKRLKGKRNHFWQPRYYDFNVFTTRKFKEKIQYIHRNPVILLLSPEPEPSL
ncbi:MAG: transposase [Edaphobacter sp.]